MFVASFINYLDRATISVALPLISLDLRLGPEMKGWILAAFFTSYAVMQIPVGWWSDQLNLKWLYAGLFSVWSLACGFTGFVESLGVLILARVILGIGESIYYPGGSKIVSLLFAPSDRGFPSGFFDSGTRWGIALGTPLIAALIARYGWRRMFMLVGFSALAWIIPWLIVAPANLRSPAAENIPSPARRRRRITFNRNLLGMALGYFCFDYYWYLYVTWLPDYLFNVRHLTLLRAGFYAGLPYLVFGLSTPLGGWISDALIHRGFDVTRTRKTMLSIGFLCGIMLIPAVRATTAEDALGFLVAGSFAGLCGGNMGAIIQTCAPPDEVGLWSGFNNFFGNIGGILAPVITGSLILRTGSFFAAFVLAAGILAAGIVAYVFIVGEVVPPNSPSGSPCLPTVWQAEL
jgi:MFS family permease